VYVDRPDGECDRLEVRIADHSLYFRAHGLIPLSPTGGHPVNAEFNWWLLIVGLVLGAALTWLVMAESTRRDADVTDSEQRSESLWIATALTAAGRPTEDDRVEEILRLHREYLGAPPPDDPGEVRPPASNEHWSDPGEDAAAVEDAPADSAIPDAVEAPAEDRA
jgi:hypothetical protein